MLRKLQRKTLVISQFVGYAFTLIVGVTIILLITQLYFDVKPLLYEQTEVIKKKTAVINKNITVFKSVNKDAIYFTDEELREISEQPFVKDLAKFNAAAFKVSASTIASDNIPVFYTDLFFESIADDFLDTESSEWVWDESQDFIPIIMPDSYLALYNFGFAESQGLPVLSEALVSQVEFNIQISGKGKSKEYRSKIVGFTNKINSILVPDEFLDWANSEFGGSKKQGASRILIEFTDPSDQSIPKFFNERNYSINEDSLDDGKLLFFFNISILLVSIISLVIIVLSVVFIVLSVNLIIHRNREVLLNLYHIGYNYKQIARFYLTAIYTFTVISLMFAYILSDKIRHVYLEKINEIIDYKFDANHQLLYGFLILGILLVLYRILIIKNIRKLVGA